MPPSINPESLERNTSTGSHHSSSQQSSIYFLNNERDSTTMSVMNRQENFEKLQHYESDNEDYDGCGSIALFERPTWSQSLRRLKWCCPGTTLSDTAKVGVEYRGRTHSESTASSKSSRHVSPTPAAPAYQWEFPPRMQYPPAPQGWYAPPGYPSPYLSTNPNLNGYQAWGYPPVTHVSYVMPSPRQQQPQQQQPHYPQQYGSSICPPPPPQLFHNKTYGYDSPSPGMPARKNTAPESYQAPPYDSGNESEASRKSSSTPRNSVTTPRQRITVKPPRVQRRSSAPVHSSPLPSSHKEACKDVVAGTHPPLPPKQPSRKNIMAARPRLPSEMSRTSVGTTNSRHRRQAHDSFQFSTISLREIAREGPVPVGPPPLSFIEVQALQRTNSWSSWEYDDQTHHDDDDGENSMLLSPDEDEIAGYISPADEEAVASPIQSAKEAPAEWMLNWAQGNKTTIEHPKSPASRTSRASEAPPVPTKDSASGPVYLPESQELNEEVIKTGASLVFSGWAAVTEGDSMRAKFALSDGDEIPIEHKDICYLQLIQDGTNYFLKIHQTQDVKSVTLNRNLQALSQEVDGRAGRCVLLQDSWSRQVLWTILPVSLPSYFFREGRLLSARNFLLLQSAMFTPFYNATTGTPEEWSHEYCMRRYAPDAQHDAAMHILFSIDVALSSTTLVS